MSRTLISQTAPELQRRLGVVLEFLASHPDLPTPTHINIEPSRGWQGWEESEVCKPSIDWLVYGDVAADEQLPILQQIVRTLRGKVDKTPSGAVFYVKGETETFTWTVAVYRDAVCRKVVKGTKTIEVPDPKFVAPTIEREVEDVEWVCEPILAGS